MLCECIVDDDGEKYIKDSGRERRGWKAVAVIWYLFRVLKGIKVDLINDFVMFFFPYVACRLQAGRLTWGMQELKT